jgi:hypothetical protein
MHLLRCLVFIEATHQCFVHPVYIDTKSNHLVDDLSRNNLASFLFKVSTAKPGGRMDLAALETSVQGYFQHGLAPSTQKMYSSAMKRFHTFCATYTVTTPFPLSEHLLCSFAAYLADQNLAPQTIKSYLSALRNTQISLGLPDPREQSSLPILKRVQAGISRIRMLKGSPPRIRLPITAHILGKIQTTLNASTDPDKTVIWAIAATAFFGFFRLGELLPTSLSAFHPAKSLAWGDVAVDNQAKPTMIQLHLKTSKCDQYGSGSDIVVGRTGNSLCPVTALMQYIDLRGNQAGPFFLDASHAVITKQRFVTRIRELLNSIGLPQHQYAGHSFRIGAATTAAAEGIEDSTIQTLGRWHSAAFLQYIRTPQTRLAAISATLAGTNHPKH